MYDERKVEDVVLALLHLNAFTDRYGRRASKSLDWAALDRLHARGLISDPKSRAKSVALTDEDVAAPALVDVEVMAVLRKRWLAGDVDDNRFDAAMHDLRDLAVERHPMQPLLPRMYEHRFNLTAYDATYVALAEAFECPLLTSDRRLARAPGLRCDVTLLER